MSEKQGEPPSYVQASSANTGNSYGGTYSNEGAPQQQQQQQYVPQQQQQQQQQYVPQQQQQQQYVYQQQQQQQQQQPQFDGQQPQQYAGYNNVIVNQPQQNLVYSAPPDYLGLAVFATLLCCWPIGIMAIIRALDARRAVDRGDLHTATSEAGQAKKLSIIAMICGGVLVIITIVVVVVVVKNQNYCYGYSC